MAKARSPSIIQNASPHTHTLNPDGPQDQGVSASVSFKSASHFLPGDDTASLMVTLRWHSLIPQPSYQL